MTDVIVPGTPELGAQIRLQDGTLWEWCGPNYMWLEVVEHPDHLDWEVSQTKVPGGTGLLVQPVSNPDVTDNDAQWLRAAIARALREVAR